MRLVKWAAAALEGSSNQPVLPHAIIALNASETHLPDDAWDVEKATRDLMENLSHVVSSNPEFQRYAKFWNNRGRRIDTLEQLILSYYSSIKVVRIPADGRPNLVQNQISKLAENIKSGCQQSRMTKETKRMLLNADELQPYLQNAFDHFACNLDFSFDFVQASFTISPIPPDFGGNILKLALQLMRAWQNRATAVAIFEEVSVMVAGCIMLDSARNKIRGMLTIDIICMKPSALTIPRYCR